MITKGYFLPITYGPYGDQVKLVEDLTMKPGEMRVMSGTGGTMTVKNISTYNVSIPNLPKNPTEKER